jgi:hypothetical protein
MREKCARLRLLQCAILRSKFASSICYDAAAVARCTLGCHFRYTAKFSVRPPHENVDVNLTVAWWGNARGSAV